MHHCERSLYALYLAGSSKVMMHQVDLCVACRYTANLRALENYQGCISRSQPPPVFCLAAVQGFVYNVTMVLGTLTGLVVEVRGEHWKLLAQYENSGGTSNRPVFPWLAPFTGDFWLVVRGRTNDSVGTFSMDVSTRPPPGVESEGDDSERIDLAAVSAKDRDVCLAPDGTSGSYIRRLDRNTTSMLQLPPPWQEA